MDVNFWLNALIQLICALIPVIFSKTGNEKKEKN